MPEPERPARPTMPPRPLHTVARIGPFFAVRTDPPGPAGLRAEGYVPLAEVYVAGPPAADRLAVAPPALRHRYTTVARRLGTDELRVAASLGFQGLAGRLWSLAVGCAALTGRVPDLDPRRLWWHPEHSAPRELWLPDADATPDPVDPTPVADLAERVRATVIDQHLAPLHRVAAATSGLSGALLWGNAGSALAGALGVLHGWLHAPARPGDGVRAEDREAATVRARALARDLFAAEPLRSTGHWSPGPRPAFRRGTCCLYYRVPGGGLCGDCVLPRVPGR
ncbi:(2Fe-2S)-binding protein [Streptomyces sp. 71268]|uniref:(2Fe-2S)-binding protein n=1 Tax=Streptomyces sp. 71268 TaxID=3002640 RepID=UPI0023F7A74E|nr:(2Fe-2S)-binding protein [Streptomyces sp. 71268]WEV29364.1 (2Fe-2S)-binding protein [Streptomyces sp. 71268]